MRESTVGVQLYEKYHVLQRQIRGSKTFEVQLLFFFRKRGRELAEERPWVQRSMFTFLKITDKTFENNRFFQTLPLDCL